jgi:ATP-dependent RNA helicase DDX56/DBP9
MLMSATMSPEVDRLAALMLHSPIVLDLTAAGAADAASKAPAIVHTYVHVTSESNRLLSVLAILRLGLVKKKALLFVNSPDVAYRVRLLLEAFGTRAGTLVATLPLASRHRAIEQFNASAFDVLVAAEAASSSGSCEGTDAAEFGVTRGVDFQGVRTVLNVEVPASLSAYTHRVGRTGRAGAEGLAVSLIGSQDTRFFAELQEAFPVRTSDCPGFQHCHPLVCLSPSCDNPLPVALCPCCSLCACRAMLLLCFLLFTEQT